MEDVVDVAINLATHTRNKLTISIFQEIIYHGDELYGSPNPELITWVEG